MGFSAPAIALAACLPLLAPRHPPQPAPTPLAGPAAEGEPERGSLVAFDFAGRLRRPEVPPEVAAAALLDLDPMARAAVDAVLARRAALLDVFVRENVDLLSEFETAEATGDALDQLGLAQRAFVALTDLRAQGTLQGSIRAALPPSLAHRYDAMLAEYWRAVVLEAKRSTGENGKPRGGVEAVIEERANSFGREIELAFERQMRSGDLVYHLLTNGIDLRPEQTARIRQAVAEVVERRDVEGDTRAQALLGASILAYLDPDQAAVFIENVKKLSR